MTLRPYEDIAPEPLAFPIGGKTYVVCQPGYLTGLKLQEVIDGKVKAEEFGDDAEALWRLMLGPVFDEMKADNASGEAITRAAFAALTDYKFGRAAAEKVWESGLDPMALLRSASETTEPQPSPTSKAKGSTRSRAKGSASRTRKPAPTTP